MMRKDNQETLSYYRGGPIYRISRRCRRVRYNRLKWKALGINDVATKRQIDNPVHNTAISARALDTDVLKTVYKNDIGSLPDAVMDVYFWNWSDYFFGYLYSDTLSFSGRYFYQF